MKAYIKTTFTPTQGQLDAIKEFFEIEESIKSLANESWTVATINSHAKITLVKTLADQIGVDYFVMHKFEDGIIIISSNKFSNRSLMDEELAAYLNIPKYVTEESNLLFICDYETYMSFK